MLYKEMIAAIKREIKFLTAKQIEDKKILRQKHHHETWRTQVDVLKRRAQITSNLVFYNEIKGKEPSHNLENEYLLDSLRMKYADVIQESQVVTAD